ncbi:hypothetical protein ACIHDR_43170 [Nocardia sp. NPDC052278]|uniref:nSTAND1 domain-containing NTPase n=1 Tax=unclassified Nocardia TaxID=2637762 RepID=UPI0036AF0603
MQRLPHCVRQPSVLMVSGVPGAGKSSLLRAGILPHIRGEVLAEAPQAHAWPGLVLTPGHTPLDTLAVVPTRTAPDTAVPIPRQRGPATPPRPRHRPPRPKSRAARHDYIGEPAELRRRALAAQSEVPQQRIVAIPGRSCQHPPAPQVRNEDPHHGR